LAEILAPIRAVAPPDLLVGFETSDDAAVYRLDSERAMVCTADFITPVVDDPRTFGRVAAANSLSDIYAMGGVPLVALNLLGYPPAGVPNAVLGEILVGAGEMCAEAGCAVGGGHSVRDEEVKFGLSVTGLVHPDRILRNSGARPGDVLVLTKPLGTGALVAAMKKGALLPGELEALVGSMTALNSCGTGLHALGVTACTDVTGFGLTGHALEMAQGSGVTLTISAAALPQLPRAAALCAAGFTCGGTRSNASHTAGGIRFDTSLGEGLIGLLNDPQTSGGLLLAVPRDRLDDVLAFLRQAGTLAAAVLGEASPRPTNGPWLDFRP
jgi:selenide,water dikinase